MNDAVLTSRRGEVVSFKDVLIIMTSNIGAEVFYSKNSIGFSDEKDAKQNVKTDVDKSLKRAFRPEFINRLDEIIMFNQLCKKDVTRICKIMLADVKRRAARIEIKLDFDVKCIAELSRLGYDVQYGARPLMRVIDTKINAKN